MSRRLIAAALLLLLSALFLTGAAKKRGELRASILSFGWNTGKIDMEAVSRAAEHSEKTVRVVVWEKLYGCRASGNAEKTLDVAIWQGDSRLLSGGEAIAGDLSGLSISETAAQSLFGSVNVVGLEIRLDDKLFTIRGVFQSGKADIMMPWDGVSKREFSKMALAFPGIKGDSWEKAGRQFLSDAGLSQPETSLDAKLLEALAGFHMPGFMIPTRWSDFAAWERNFAEMNLRIASYLRAELSPVDLQMLSAAFFALLYALLGALCAFKGFFRLLPDKNYWASSAASSHCS